MEFGDLKKAVEKLELSEEMQARIIQNCRLTAASEKEKNTMKKKGIFHFGKPTVATVLCLCVTVGAATAASQSGWFRDIINWNGAVIGTAYEQATNEIAVTATAVGDELTVTAALLTPDAAPYRELKTLGMGEYQIVDLSGAVVVAGESTEPVEIVDGAAKLRLSLDGINSGNYKLLVSSFVGEKKADQPLQISGSWECDFTV